MKDVKLIVNPPYSCGDEVISSLIGAYPNSTADTVIIMPLAQYKTKQVLWTDGNKYPLYQFVDLDTITFNSNDFDDAYITENNCITKLLSAPNINQTYMDLVLKSFDPNMLEFYKWNIEHNIGLTWKNTTNTITPDDLDPNLDFIDSGRCCSKAKCYGYHNKNINQVGYNWNVLKKTIGKWLSELGYIHFPTAHAKDMFTMYAYNYFDDKYDCLESQALCGCRVTHVGQMYFYMVPQISWDTIDTDPLTKDLWAIGDYDTAVLTAMHLKKENNKIIKE